MKKVNIILVGNTLTTFANNKNIFTYDQFNSLLEVEHKLNISQNSYLISLGQGLSDTQIQALPSHIASLDLSERFTLSDELLHLKRATRQATHKRNADNIMISSPVKHAETAFKSYLMLNEQCAEMSDHLTGQHIQGMVLIEAARQMINAVSEEHLIQRDRDIRKGFVLNSIESTFIEYVFPSEVSFHLTLNHMRGGLGGNFKAEASIDVRQHNKLMMKIDLGFSVIDKTTLLDIESMMAAQSVAQSLSFHQGLSVVEKRAVA
jgi:hypothetical protein